VNAFVTFMGWLFIGLIACAALLTLFICFCSKYQQDLDLKDDENEEV